MTSPEQPHQDGNCLDGVHLCASVYTVGNILWYKDEQPTSGARSTKNAHVYGASGSVIQVTSVNPNSYSGRCTPAVGAATSRHPSPEQLLWKFFESHVLNSDHRLHPGSIALFFINYGIDFAPYTNTKCGFKE